MDSEARRTIVKNDFYAVYKNLVDAVRRDDEMTVHLTLFKHFGDPSEFAHHRVALLDFVRQIKRLDSLTQTIDEYPVILAAKLGSTTILTKLHLFGFSLQETDIDGCDAMMYACHEGNLAMVNWLLDHGFEIKQKDLQGWTALHYAAAMGNEEIVRRVFPFCKTADERTLQGLTPLHLAAAEGKTSVVDYLISRGAQVDAKDSTGMTPTMHAAIDGHTETIVTLVRNGASKETQSIESMSPFDYACLNGHQEAALALKIDPVALDKSFRGRTLGDWIRKHRMYALVAK
jgi:hypothetical protein